MTRTVVRMLALHLGQGPLTDLLTRQFPVRFPVLSSHAPSAFQRPRNEYEIEPQKGRGAHARIRTGDLFLTKEMLYRLSYVGGPNTRLLKPPPEPAIARSGGNGAPSSTRLQAAAGYGDLFRGPRPASPRR